MGSLSYKFALYDVNKDGVKELFLQNNEASHADGWARALSYHNGKTVKLGALDDITVYKKSGVVCEYTIHQGYVDAYYYKLQQGKWKQKAYTLSVATADFNSDYYGKPLHKGKNITTITCKINGKKVSSYKTYKADMNKLLKNDEKTVKLTYHKNTAANREKYLK